MEYPRLNLPSASSFYIDALCAGRQQRLREFGDMPEPQDEDAERGTRLHAAWEEEDPTGLDGEDIEIYERGLKLIDEVKTQWVIDKFPNGVFRNVKEGPREERFYSRDDKGQVDASGQADRHYIAGDFALVCDFKSLWCYSLTPAELNWQARLLSVLVAREYGATHVRFAFLKAMMGKADIVDYTSEDLERAQYSIQQILWESRQPHGQRRPGAHCRRCKAAAGCPEAQSWVNLPSVYSKAYERIDGPITPKAAAELVQQVSLRDCVYIWSGSNARHNIEDACKARLKALSDAERAELGLALGKPKVLKPITDACAAYQFLSSVGVDPWSAMKFSNSELATIVQAKFELNSKKEAEAWIASKLGGCITRQECERPLERI